MNCEVSKKTKRVEISLRCMIKHFFLHTAEFELTMSECPNIYIPSNFSVAVTLNSKFICLAVASSLEPFRSVLTSTSLPQFESNGSVYHLAALDTSLASSTLLKLSTKPSTYQ